MDLTSSYTYLAISYYFDRDDVALPGMQKFFKSLSEEKLSDACKLQKYQNKRGGRVVLQDIVKPPQDVWGDAAAAMSTAMTMARRVNQAIKDVWTIADQHNDAQLLDFLQGEFMHRNVQKIKEIGGHQRNIERNGPGLGEHLFDKDLA